MVDEADAVREWPPLATWAGIGAGAPAGLGTRRMEEGADMAAAREVAATGGRGGVEGSLGGEDWTSWWARLPVPLRLLGGWGVAERSGRLVVRRDGRGRGGVAGGEGVGLREGRRLGGGVGREGEKGASGCRRSGWERTTRGWIAEGVQAGWGWLALRIRVRQRGALAGCDRTRGRRLAGLSLLGDVEGAEARPPGVRALASASSTLWLPSTAANLAAAARRSALRLSVFSSRPLQLLELQSCCRLLLLDGLPGRAVAGCCARGRSALWRSGAIERCPRRRAGACPLRAARQRRRRLPHARRPRSRSGPFPLQLADARAPRRGGRRRPRTGLPAGLMTWTAQRSAGCSP